MTYTENYNLKKPDTNDYVSPAAFNENADAIDAKLKEHDDHAAAKDNPHEVTAAQVGAAEASHTHNASTDLTGTLPIAKGGTGATDAATALSNLRGMSKLVTYYGGSQIDKLDTATDGSMMVAVTSANNAGLYSVIGGNFAYVYQFFYSSVSDTANRMQIAHGDRNNKMATRYYKDGAWSAWELIYTQAAPPSVTTNYTGTGVSGSSNPNTLTFNFAPKFMMIQGENTTENGIYIGGSSMLMYSDNGYDKQSVANNPVSVSTSSGATTISWYYDIVENTPAKQLNKSGTIYYCVAFA